MTRRSGLTLLGIAIAIFCVCAALVAYRVLSHRPPASSHAPVVASTEPAGPEATVSPEQGRISTIIDLPGDPVLVHRGATVAPHSLRVALPIALAANAPKVESSAFFLNSPLVSSDGGFMGKFPEAAEGAEVADVGLISGIQVADSNDAAAAGFDDDGGASTPESPQQSVATDLNSTQLDVTIGGSNAQAQIKEAIIRVVVQEKISDLLIRNGFSEDSARAIEAAAKTIYNVQSLPPSVGSSRVDLQACKLEYSIVSPK